MKCSWLVQTAICSSFKIQAEFWRLNMKKQNFKISLVTVLYWLSDKIRNNLNILGSMKYVSIIVQLISSLFFYSIQCRYKKVLHYMCGSHYISTGQYWFKPSFWVLKFYHWERHSAMDPEYPCTFLLGFSRMQGPDYSLHRSFLRVEFVGHNLERWGNVSPQTKSRLVTIHQQIPK